MPGASPWIVSQLGAREHYSIPRALLEAGISVRLVTDYWASARRWSPGRLRERRHPQIADRLVTDFGTRLLGFEVLSRLRRRRDWRLIESRNGWFDRLAAQQIGRSERDGTLFAYSYAGCRTLAAARKRGWTTLLGQIDPGPVEWELVQARREKAGLPPEPEPSAAYWKGWREECDLADAIIVNSEWSRQALRQEGIPSDKTHVVSLAYEGDGPATTDSDEHCQKLSSARPLRILFLGQVIVRKGVLEILEAIDRLIGQPLVWTFAGGGEVALLEKLRQHPQTRVLGPVRRQEAAIHYREADLFLLPTHSDGFAITQLEAAAHSLPMIVSRNCGSVVQDGVTGLVLDSVTATEIIKAVMSILNEPERLSGFRRELRKRPQPRLADLAADLLRIREAAASPTPKTLADV